MKTVVIVLNERPGAKHRWPAMGELAVRNDDGTWTHCCLGCHGLTVGVKPEVMQEHTMPGDCVIQRPRWWTGVVWRRRVPDAVLAEMRKALGPNMAVHALPDPHAAWVPEGKYEGGYIAASINDLDGVVNDRQNGGKRARDRAVAALRILFRWLGQTRNERWIIKHLK